MIRHDSPRPGSGPAAHPPRPNLSPTRPPTDPRGLALWGGFLLAVFLGGHSYGGGWGGGN